VRRPHFGNLMKSTSKSDTRALFHARLRIDAPPPNAKMETELMSQAPGKCISELANDPSEDAKAPNPWMNLENTFVHIDGQRYKTVDLLKLLLEKLK